MTLEPFASVRHYRRCYRVEMLHIPFALWKPEKKSAGDITHDAAMNDDAVDVVAIIVDALRIPQIVVRVGTAS